MPDVWVTPFGVLALLFTAAAVALAVRSPPRIWSATVGPAAPTLRSPIPPRRSGPGFGLCVATGWAAGLVTISVCHGWLGWLAVIPAVVVGVGVTEGLARFPSSRVRMRERELMLQTPQALDLLARALTAGLPLRSATAAVVRCFPGPVSDEWAGVLQQIDLGVGEVEAWRSLTGHPQLGAAAADLARSVQSGTLLGVTLAVHAEEARAVRAAAVDVAARKVGVRSVLPLMLCFIPAFLLLGIVPTLVSAVLAALAPS